MEQDTTGRPYFTFFRSYFNSIDKLSDEMQLPLYRAIALYCLDFQTPDFSNLEDANIIQAIWEGILPNLTANNNKYRAGKNGGLPKGRTNNPNGRRGKQEQSKNKAETKQLELEREIEDKNNPLNLPFSSPSFLDSWNKLRKQPKWKKKTQAALQKCLDQLSSYPEEFALMLIDTALANDWQGVVFPDTPEAFKKWEKTRAGESAPGPSQSSQQTRSPRIFIDTSKPLDKGTI